MPVLRDEGLVADLFITVPDDLVVRPGLLYVADLLLTGAVLRVTVLLFTDDDLVTELLLPMAADLFVAGALRLTDGAVAFLLVTADDDLRTVSAFFTVGALLLTVEGVRPVATLPDLLVALLLIFPEDLRVVVPLLTSAGLVAELLLTLLVDLLETAADLTSEDLVAVLLLTAVEVLRALPVVTFGVFRLTVCEVDLLEELVTLLLIPVLPVLFDSTLAYNASPCDLKSGLE